MPAKSAAQKRLMDAAAHNPAFAKKVGIPTSVATEFSEASKGQKFGKGGDNTRPDLQKIAKEKTDHGKTSLFKKGGKVMAKKEMHSEKGEMKQDIAQDKKLIKKAFSMHDKQEHKGEHTNLTKLKKGGMAMKKVSMKETMGPRTMSKDVEAGSNKLTKFGESAVQKRGHTKGTNLGDSGPTKGIMGMCGGGKAMKKYSAGGSASSRADGIASKGKTKGKIC